MEYLRLKARRKKLKFESVDREGGLPVRKFVLAAVFLAVVFCVAKAVHYLYTDPSFEVRTVKVEGAACIPKADVLALAALPKKENIMKIKNRDVAARLLSNPQIERAEIRRQFPSQITIYITERRPVAFIGKDGAFQVDAGGCVFPRLKNWVKPSPYIASDATRKIASGEQWILTGLSFMREAARISGDFASSIEKIEITGDDEVLFAGCGSKAEYNSVNVPSLEEAEKFLDSL